MVKRYIHQPVALAELESLQALATDEEGAFFDRNPHLVRPYRNRLLLVALCQGAALQFLGRGYGVNDFDVHLFYAQNPAKPRLSRAVKRISATVGAFPNVAVDFVRTVVPPPYTSMGADPIDQIRNFLRKPPTANASHLAQKAVIGLMPQSLFSTTVWPAAQHAPEATGG